MSDHRKPGDESQPQLSFAELWAGKVKGPKRAATTFGGGKKLEAASSAGGQDRRRVWTVASLVTDVRQHIEREYDDVWVEGEISNLRAAPSGHMYFTLKDGDAQLPVVLFRREAMLLRFRPEDGMAVLARGKVSVYESRGQMQLVAETLEPRGAGALQIAFEQLKAKLAAEGLFDEERKRALPAFPRCIGVITSPTGAAIQDILNVLGRRHGRLSVLIYPALMQGEQAAREVSAGIRWFNSQAGSGERPSASASIDILLLARGGGSIEDLAPFNDEALARAIAASEIPVVSAIGHETDFTIADFVADLRAPTPSAAAELVTAAQHRIEERVADLERRLERGVRFRLMEMRHRLAGLSAEASFARMRDGLGRRQQRLDELRFRLEGAWAGICRGRTERLRAMSERLLRQDVRRQLTLVRARLERLEQRLGQGSQTALRGWERRYGLANARLHALSPLAVLGRGYALVFDARGRLVKSAHQVSVGDGIKVRVANGSFEATVTVTETASGDSRSV